MNNEKRTAAVFTLGCRVNQYESDYITQTLASRGFEIVPFGTPADVTVINTCTVTSESDRKSRQMIRRAVAASPDGAVIVTGCYAETGTDEVRRIDGVSYITGNAAKSKIPDVAETLVAGDVARFEAEDVNSAAFDPMMLTSPERTRSYIKIEDGCDNKCAYCIISAARGNVRSKPIEEVVCEAKRLREAGCREVILTGIETSAYGRDLGRDSYYGESLASVIEEVAKLGFERIGLGSLEPTVMNEAFVTRISRVKSLLPHFHLSVQSGSTTVLNRMRRRYNARMLSESIDRLKRAVPGVTLSADIITGFPGESKEEFSDTLELAAKHRFLHLHIFPYSIRQGTEAAGMPGQVSSEVKNARLRELSAKQAQIKRELLEEYVHSHESAPVDVLVEKLENGSATGHSEHYVEVSFDVAEAQVGEVVQVVLENTDGETCFGKCIK